MKVEGRKSIAETKPDVIAMARRLSRKTPKGGQRTLCEIAAEMAMTGHLTSMGKPYTATAVARRLDKAWKQETLLPV